MAGKKKTKKPAGNPARGFATTSLPSRQTRVVEEAPETASATTSDPAGTSQPAAAEPSSAAGDGNTVASSSAKKSEKELTPEEFEHQLDESQLQLLVEKHGAKVRRDAQRQKTRLETDRRLLRASAETLNAKRWLPKELVDHMLELIKAESRFAATAAGSEVPAKNPVTGKSAGQLPSEEDFIVRLWTLQETLGSMDFPEDKIEPVLLFTVRIAPSISAPSSGKSESSVWGLEEALDWFARECEPDELPDYSGRKQRSQTGGDTPIPSGATTPRFLELAETRSLAKKQKNSRSARSAAPRKLPNVTLEDIEPDQLLPFYLEIKEQLFAVQRSRSDAPKDGRASRKISSSASGDSAHDEDADELLLLAKIDLVEKDVLFDKPTATQIWRERKTVLEKEYAANCRMKKQMEQIEAEKEKLTSSVEEPTAHPASNNSAAGVSEEAERITAEILAQQDDDDDGDDDALTGLFDSVPVAEVDPITGETVTALNGADGIKIIIRDFGRFTGMSPVRILEEACRSRDSSVKITYHALSDISYASRHAVGITWSKPQDLPSPPEVDGVEAFATPTQFAYQMESIAAPDARQSEGYVATVALFAAFGSSTKDEKVAMRLPPSYKDLWSELADRKKSKADEQDRELVRRLRDLVRKRMEREEEDGVLLSGAFKGRQAKNSTESDQSDQERTQRHVFSADYYQNIWLQKCCTPRFQQMLVSRMQLPMWQFRNQVVEAVERNQVVIVCGETGCGKSTQVPSFLLEHQLLQGNHCKIYCTEPRRISAISLARRVSEELGEGRNDLGTPRSLVGYAVRLDAHTSRESRLVYATVGIVMRMLEGSNDLSEITHLVLDEVHERSIDSDFLLIILKRLMIRRKDLKVVLMSATVDADRFSRYMGGAPVLNVPGRTFPVRVAYLEDAVDLTGYSLDQRNGTKEKIVDLDDDLEPETDSSSKQELVKSLKAANYSGRTMKTLSQMDEYKIDHDLIVQLITRIANDPQYVPFSNAILVFLPGIAEIRTLNDLLLGDRAIADNWLVYPLHSTIASEDQEAAFLIPPPGIRKIVLATNIAETGITIPDVTCVIDTGKHREMRFDERRQLSRLIDTFIARANAKQRRGRAGRVQEGLCFHLFTKYRHDNIMSDQQTPEILRLSLQDLAIRVKMCRLGGIEATLREALDPPSAKNIRRAIDALVDARALTVSNTENIVGPLERHTAAAGAAATAGPSGGPADNGGASLNAKEELTPLGIQLARLPLDVFLGKLILLGTVFRCLDMAVTAAALLSGAKSPFQAPFGQRTQADAARRAFRRGDSDILTIYNAYCAWRRVCQSSVGGGGGGGTEFQFCRKNYLNPQALANVEELKGQLLSALADSGALQLTGEERQGLSRARFGGGGGRRRGGGHTRFVEVPKRVDTNSDNDVVAQAVIAWSFYPKLLVRDGVKGGWRNVASNQAISPHPSSVNKGRQVGSELKWMSYYHIMQSKSVYHAHETTAAEAFAIALLCGDVRADMYAGVLVLDGNRARFACPDWKSALVIKTLRARLRDAMARFLKWPAKQPTAQHERWIEAWQRVFAAAWEARQKAMAAAGV